MNVADTRNRWHVPTTAQGSGTETVAIVVVSLMCLIAAGIHLYVTPEHFSEWWVYGVFFIVVAGGQLATIPLVIWWRTPQILTTLVAANVALVLIWVVSRTSGLPIGPPVLDETGGLADPKVGGYGAHAVGVPESVGVLDLTATISELIVVIVLCAMLPANWRRWVLNGLLAVGATVWVLFGLGVLA